MNYNEPLDYNQPCISLSCIYIAGDKCKDHNRFDIAQKILDYIEPVIIKQSNPIYRDFQLCYFINNSLACNWYTNDKKIKKTVIDIMKRELEKNNPHIINIIKNNKEIEKYENKNEII